MDDQNDGGHARAPEIPDLVRLCDAMNKAGAEYLVIGGFAIAMQSLVRTTKDIDFLVNPAPENIKKVKQALAVIDAETAAEIDDHDVVNYNVVRVGLDFVVDLLGKACGVDYATAKKNMELKVLDGVAIPIPDKATLIKTKDTVRPHDQADCYALRCLIAEEDKKAQK